MPILREHDEADQSPADADAATKKKRKPLAPVSDELREELLEAANAISERAGAVARAYLDSGDADRDAARVLVLALLPELRGGPAGVRFQRIRANAGVRGVDGAWKRLVRTGWLRVDREPFVSDEGRHLPRTYGLGERAREVLREYRQAAAQTQPQPDAAVAVSFRSAP